MRQLLTAIALLALGACSADEESAATATATAETPTPSAAIGSAAMAQWSRSCALCHVNGEGGAPVVGDHQAWAPRLAQGEDVLLQHTVEGLNNMPPLGYCMDCEADDLRQIIRFMSGGGA